MIPVEEALAACLALARPLGTEVVPLAEAGGRVLAEAAVARRDQPPFAASAMDGYAIGLTDRVAGNSKMHKSIIKEAVLGVLRLRWR